MFMCLLGWSTALRLRRGESLRSPRDYPRIVDLNCSYLVVFKTKKYAYPYCV
jgi:hypothetical protein